MNENPPPAGAGAESPDDTLAQLRAHSPPASRYDRRGEIARGGMGSILEVWDADLRRTLAMKVVRETPGGPSSEVGERLLARFLDEARVTGQLEHPGIVPVHELGLGPDGQAYFTMPLVRGRTLTEVLELVEAGAEGWTLARALNVILRACEALSYAHSKGVVHRDVKPDNVMVGAFGEVVVMDWGVAKVLDGAGAEPSRTGAGARSGAARDAGDVAARGGTVEVGDGSATHHTLQGDIVGTPAYMPPEQARGELDRIGPTTDVYAMGAILYQLLAGHAPYGGPGASSAPGEVVMELLERRPTPLGAMERSIPDGLIAICERAMQRDPGDRYPDLGEMAAALRAWLEQGITQARTALRTSRLLRGLSVVFGCFWWVAALGLVLLGFVAFVPVDKGVVSFDLTLPLILDEATYEIVPRADRVDGVALDDVQGRLTVQSRSWAVRIGTLLPAVAIVGVVLMVVGTVRRILTTLRSGTPFSADNVRRIRWLGIVFLLLAVASSVYRSLSPWVASKLVTFEGLAVDAGPRISFSQIGMGVLLLVLAEVFRVGAELERGRSR